MSVAERIKGYYAEDIEYLIRVLEEVPLPDLFQGLKEMLSSTSGDDIARADVFIRDVNYQANPENSEFKKQLDTSGIPDVYCKNLFKNDFYARSIATSTLTIFRDWLS